MGVTARGFVSVASVALPETSGGFWVLANFRFCARVFPLLFFFSFFLFLFLSLSPFDGSFLFGWIEKMAENFYSFEFFLVSVWREKENLLGFSH